MSTRFHINLETGEPGRCKAMFNCPFGDFELDHFDSAEDARKAYENIMESETFAAKVEAQKFVLGTARMSSRFDSEISVMEKGSHGGYFAPDTIVSAAKNLMDKMPELAPLKDAVSKASARAAYATSRKGKKAERYLALAVDTMAKPAERHIAIRTVDALAAARASAATPKDKIKNFVGGKASEPSAQALAVVRALRQSGPISFKASGFVLEEPIFKQKTS